jgi:hypothetical protein
MDYFSSLLTPLLCTIHRLVLKKSGNQLRGLRSALALEAASKQLNTLLRGEARFPIDLQVSISVHGCQLAAFWRFVAAHGHRFDCITFKQDTASRCAVPLISDQEGVSRARAVAAELATVTSLHALGALPNLHHLGVRGVADSSSLEALPSLTTLRSLALRGGDWYMIGSWSSLDFLSSLTALTNLLLNLPGITTLDSLTWLAANLQTLALASNSALSTLGPISSLSSLTCLTIRDIQPNVQTDLLAPLHTLQRLRKLCVHGQFSLTGSVQVDLHPISRLECLRTLDIDGLAIDDAQPITALRNSLQDLRLCRCSFSGTAHITALTTLSTLRFLTITDIEISTNFLALITSLERLRIFPTSSQSVDQLEPVRSLSALQTLRLGGMTRISSLEPLSQLGSLHALTLHDLDRVTALDAIGELPALRSLLLAGGMSSVSSLAPLSQLRALRQLELYTDMGQVTALDAICSLSALQYLYIEGMPSVSSLEPLRQLRSLHELKLRGLGNVATLDAVGDLSALQLLHIRGACSVSSLDPLSQLSSLHTLHLGTMDSLSTLRGVGSLSALRSLVVSSSSRVSSLEPLRQLRSLQWLSLDSMRGISSLQPISLLTGLRYVRLMQCPDVHSVAPLDSLTRLDSVVIAHCPRCLDDAFISSTPPIAIPGADPDCRLFLWQVIH